MVYSWRDITPNKFMLVSPILAEFWCAEQVRCPNPTIIKFACVDMQVDGRAVYGFGLHVCLHYVLVGSKYLE